jgi:hypothetical protein
MRRSAVLALLALVAVAAFCVAPAYAAEAEAEAVSEAAVDVAAETEFGHFEMNALEARARALEMARFQVLHCCASANSGVQWRSAGKIHHSVISLGPMHFQTILSSTL